MKTVNSTILDALIIGEKPRIEIDNRKPRHISQTTHYRRMKKLLRNINDMKILNAKSLSGDTLALDIFKFPVLNHTDYYSIDIRTAEEQWIEHEKLEKTVDFEHGHVKNNVKSRRILAKQEANRIKFNHERTIQHSQIAEKLTNDIRKRIVDELNNKPKQALRLGHSMEYREQHNKQQDLIVPVHVVTNNRQRTYTPIQFSKFAMDRKVIDKYNRYESKKSIALKGI